MVLSGFGTVGKPFTLVVSNCFFINLARSQFGQSKSNIDIVALTEERARTIEIDIFDS